MIQRIRQHFASCRVAKLSGTAAKLLQRVRLRTEVVALSWDIVAMRRDCEAFVQTIVNLMVQVSKTPRNRATTERNDFHVLRVSTASVHHGVEKKRRHFGQLSVS